MNTLLSISYFWSAEAVVAIFICVILPCVIVWLASRTRMHEMDRKTELAIKAIESGVQIDPDFFSKEANVRSIKEKIFGRLTTGCILSAIGIALIAVSIFSKKAITASFLGGGFLLVGIAFIVIYFIGRKQFAAEIAAEEAKIGKEQD